MANSRVIDSLIRPRSRTLPPQHQTCHPRRREVVRKGHLDAAKAISAMELASHCQAAQLAPKMQHPDKCKHVPCQRASSVQHCCARTRALSAASLTGRTASPGREFAHYYGCECFRAVEKAQPRNTHLRTGGQDVPLGFSIIASRPGPTPTHLTCTPVISSTRWQYFLACAGRSSHLRTSLMSHFQPGRLS